MVFDGLLAMDGQRQFVVLLACFDAVVTLGKDEIVKLCRDDRRLKVRAGTGTASSASEG